MKYITKKPKRYINKVFLHCSDSDLTEHDNPEIIKKWHLERGFRDIGYHFIINKNGNVHKGRNIEMIPAAQEGHNTGTIAICLTGKAIFSQEQFTSLHTLCSEINKLCANITFHGHREVSSKECPVFDYARVLNLQGNKLPKNYTPIHAFFIKLLQFFI